MIPESVKRAIDVMPPAHRRALAADLRAVLKRKEEQTTMTNLTDADRRAVAERQARIRKASGYDDRAGAPLPDPLVDPIAWLEQMDAEAAQDEVDEVIALANAPATKEPTLDDLADEEISRLNRLPPRK